MTASEDIVATGKSSAVGGSEAGGVRTQVAARTEITGGSNRAALLLFVLANLLWAGTYVTGKIALQQLSPLELNALRFPMAAVVLSPVLIRGWRQIPRDRSSLLLLGQIALMGWVLNKALEYTGLALSTASDVALLIATESLFTAALSWLVLRERITRATVVALTIGLVGAYLIVERGFAPHLGVAATGNGERIIGDLLVIGSLILESAYTIGGKRALTRLRLSPLLLTSTTIAASMLVWVPTGAVAFLHRGLPPLSPLTWMCIIYMAVGSSVVAYWLWFRGLGMADASAAAPMLFVQPLVGAALGILLLHDTLSYATLAGGVLIGLSLLLVVVGTRRESSLSPDVNNFTP
jgi:drug/metabolite transporter (DMT)-like permease